MTKLELQLAELRGPNLPPFDIPNLADYSDDPGDYAALERVFDKLALYCHDKRHAMHLRVAGDVQAAESYEANLERTWDRLPKWARW